MSLQVGTVADEHVGRARTVAACARDLRPQFRLRPGQDDLLIEWLASLAPRRRSAAIREALQQHLDSRQVPDAARWDEDADLAAALDALF